MSHQDSGLYKSFALVLGALVCFTLIILVIANMVSPTTDRNQDPLVANNIKRSIEPIGRSNVRAVEENAQEDAEAASDTAAAEETPVADSDAADTETTDAASEQPADTDAAQAETAATTETAGVDSASTGTDTAATESEQSATNTATAEPARVDTSVEIPVKVRAVVATNCAGCHQNGVQGAQRNDDTAAWQGLAGKGLDALTASVINGLGTMPPRAESPLDDAELQLAVQHMINQNLAGAPSASDSDAAATEAPASESEAADKVESASDTASDTDAVAEDTGAVAESEAVVIPDNVKAAVDTLCAACHISGVGNAPKYGDKAAWDDRMAAGLDAVTASAIAGKGAMPARGGSQLTDEEIRLAIQYMLTK